MSRGFTLVEVLVFMALLGALGWAVKPSLFPGASKRAANSTAATAALESATNAQGATAAASVAKIGEANTAAPESPAKSFIGREVPVALSLLPAPDSAALIEAERRRAAVMEGRADEARRLYESAAKQAAQLQRERDEALEARRAADLALEQSAAAEHARTMQAIGAGFIALLALAGFAYVKLYGISPATVGQALADIKGGEDPIKAFSSALSPRLHAHVRRARQLATDPEDSK